MRSLTVTTTTHGRVLIEDAADSLYSAAAGLIVCFHGYGEAAEDILEHVKRIPGASRWRIASVQALNRFYTRRDEKVVANWMTRQDREAAILDNIAYVDAAIEASMSSFIAARGVLVFAGFSQGVAMAYRAALRGRHPAAGLIALGNDIPQELKTGAIDAARWPRVLIGAGDSETWYTAGKVEADEAFLNNHGIAHTVVRYVGGHEWTEAFRDAAGTWLASMTPIEASSRPQS